jgi:hypothetical protein
MYRCLFFIGCILFLTINSYAQDSSCYKAKWQLNPSFGFNIPITKLLKGQTMDYMFEYDDHSYYLQVLSATYFFSKHWGLEFNYQGGSSKHIAQRSTNFLNAITAQYEKSYYILDPYNSANDDNYNIIGGYIQRGYLGIVYRIEKKRLIFYPELSIGFTSFYTDWAEVYLKEKNSNNVLDLQYSTVQMPKDNFTLAASAKIGYKISKRFSVAMDLSVSYYETNIPLTTTLTDLNSGNATVETYNYNNTIFTLSVGAGLIMTIK